MSDTRDLPPMTRGMRRFSLVAFFLIGAAVAAFVFGNPLRLSFLPNASRAAAPAEASLPIHVCPMHPQVVQEGPGACPICGMDLVPRDPVPASSSDDRLELDEERRRKIGVVSEPVLRETITRTARTVGILDFNADRITWINTKFSGWIERVHVTYVGQSVELGQPLFEIYSPELVSTQEEYLRALEYRESLRGDHPEARRQAAGLLRSSADRLRYWGITDEQIRDLERRGEAERLVTVRSPTGGVVTEVMDEALEGVFVQAGKNLYRIADLDSVWVHADIYESDLDWVRDGLRARVTFSHRPGHERTGRVLFLYPELSQPTRTLKACIEVDNDDGSLRAGMYADVVIEGPSIEGALTVPESAILRTGKSERVFVDLGDGAFEPREVVTGIRGVGGRTRIVDGLAEGERVVTHAQFMLDSESRMREALSRFRSEGGTP